ncbi:MAG: FtsK/SpoIIIE domain-containing protein, partial [Planctomycetia bacterium]|nr:FtsK/SpoIIIE domain-containing protein [Planctomycetia bacterium]
IGPRVIRLQVRPDLGGNITTAHYLKKAKELKIMMALSEEPLILTQAGYISVDIPRETPEVVRLGDLFERGRSTQPDSSLSFPIGVSVCGDVVWIDLTDANMTNILIGGTAGSGKSVLLQSVVLGIGRASPQGECLFTLIDPKQVTFQKFRDLPMINEGRIITEMSDAIDALKLIVEEMEIRYDMLTEAGVENIREYQEKCPEFPLFHHVIVIDEYADLLSDTSLKKTFSEVVQRLCQKGRAAGIHLILATQRPDAHVVTPLIRTNLQLKIAMKVTTERNSKIILDENGAECLAGRGDMLIGGGAVPIQRVHGPISSPEDFRFLQNGCVPPVCDALKRAARQKAQEW